MQGRQAVGRAEVLAALERSDKFVERALLALYERQTQDERDNATTTHSNGIGFSGVDAPILTSCAQWVLRSRMPEGLRLTPRQRAVVRKKVRKYVGQLVEVAEARRAATVAA